MGSSLLTILALYVRAVERLLRGEPDARAHLESQTRFLKALVEDMRDG